jgi:hypothetical protein
MLTLRTLAIVTIGAAVFAGLPLTDAQACDDDRYPCPVRAEALAQETADVPTQPAPSAQPQKKAAQPQKKVNRPAGPNEKAHAKREGEAPRSTARAKGSKPAVQEQAADSISQKSVEVAPVMVPSPPGDLNDESRSQSLVATAGTAWPVPPNAEGTGDAPAATGAEPTEAAKANAVHVVDPNELNDLDRAAAASAPAESSWITYLLLILGAALAVASGVWFFSRITSMFARRAENPRMRMSNSGQKAF